MPYLPAVLFYFYGLTSVRSKSNESEKRVYKLRDLARADIFDDIDMFISRRRR